MAIAMKGIEVVNALKSRMAAGVDDLKERGIDPCLAIVRLGSRPDDLAYERSAIKRCESVGIKCTVMEFEESISQDELTAKIEEINKDEAVHGILIFRPLPGHIDESVIKHVIIPDKDVDCLNPLNAAKVFEGDETGFAPCTPEAVMEILSHYNVDVSGKRVVVVGRSLVVGKPLSMLLLKKNATVTICHTKTRDLEAVCRSAEILIAAAGRARMITEKFLSSGQVVVDVGINVDRDGNLCGDVNFGPAGGIVDLITPVPGGVGPVTTLMLARHVIKAAEQLSRPQNK